MELNAGQKKLLKLYRKLRGSNPTGFQMVLMNLHLIFLVTGGGIAIAVAFSWPSVLQNITAPGWMLFAAFWASAFVPFLGMTYFYANQWAVIEQVTDWDRVGELIGDDE